MNDLLLGLISSYENRVQTIENLILGNKTDDDLARCCETGAKLRAALRETLVRNCSLRRKDFDALTLTMFAGVDLKRAEVEEERKLVRERLKSYLGRQKELINSLKEQLSETTPESASKRRLEALLEEMKESQKAEAEQTLAMLRGFQSRFQACHQAQQELNNRLQEALGKGELLGLDDLRCLHPRGGSAGVNKVVEKGHTVRLAQGRTLQPCLETQGSN